jgi:hypothetical protein
LTQNPIFTFKQETIPLSCKCKQPLSKGSICNSLRRIKYNIRKVNRTEGASLTVIHEEVTTLTVDYSENQQNIPSESIWSAEPIEGASTTTQQQAATISAPSDQHHIL